MVCVPWELPMYLPTTIKVALSHLSGCYICDEDPEERRERLRARALAELDERMAEHLREPAQGCFDHRRSGSPLRRKPLGEASGS
jgi:hypothetical protein